MTLLSLLNWESFSSIWFWILLLIQWSIAGMHILGVPADILSPRHPDASQVISYRLKRHIELVQTAPWVLVLLIAGLLGCVVILAGVYDVEVAQALCILMIPPLCLAGIGYRRAIALIGQPLEKKVKHLKRLHLFSQIVGLVVIFGPAIFAMAQKINFQL